MYIHKPTEGYPDNVDLIVSEKGYGKNPYIKTITVFSPYASK